MRRPLLLLALLVAIAVAACARVWPTSPFLFGRPGLTWWGHPQPLDGHDLAGPFHLTFHFAPARPGRLDLAMLRGGQVVERGVVVARLPPKGRSWKRTLSLSVSGAPLELRVEDARLLPLIGLGGPAAPLAVEVERDGRRQAAVAASPARPRPALGPWLKPLGLGVGLALAMALTGAAWRGRRAPLAARSHPRLVVAALVLHAGLAAWNAAHYPFERGLDAEAHLAYARAIAREGHIPDLDVGFQTYQPPLYYLLAASVLRLGGGSRELSWLGALLGLALVARVAAALGPRGWRGVVLVAFLPVLVVTEPQVTNETLFALLATCALAELPAARQSTGRALLAGLLAGLALLGKYTGLPILLAMLLGLIWPGPRRLSAARSVGLVLLPALLVGAWPYVERQARYGDPLIGNWDDALGHTYRQPPGYRLLEDLLPTGAGLYSHPFRARQASVWDSLYVSAVADGFGRLISTPAQHALQLALAHLAWPLVVVAAIGLAALALARPPTDPGPTSGAIALLIGLAAFASFALELPYWSSAKGVFLLALALPLAQLLECGRARVAAGSPAVAAALDAALALYAAAVLAALHWRV